jgi:hypothetical protein
MKYRIANVIAALKRSEKYFRPKFKGEIRKVRIPTEMWEDLLIEKSVSDGETVPILEIKLEAEIFDDGENQWLEWVIDIPEE